MIIRRLFVLGSALASLLLWACPQVWAQGCYPGNNPTVAVSTISALSPSDFAAQGGMTATLWTRVINVSGGIASHEVTATPGTQMGFAWASNYGASATISYYVNGNTTPYYTTTLLPNSDPGSTSLNGSNTNVWTFQQSDVGNYYVAVFKVTGSGGQTTQDKIKVTVVAGTSPSIVGQDEISSNVYYSLTTTYSGTPQILFTDCPHMQNAHHTPKATLQLQSSSGEVHAVASVTGATVPANTNVYAVVSDAISANVGDSITASYGGSMWCDIIGAWVWESLVSFRIEYAKVVAKDLGHVVRPGLDGSSIYDVAVICNNDSDPPDWQPTVVHSFSGRHPYWWGFTSLFRAPDLSGVPWISIAAFMTEIPPDPAGGPLTLARLVVEGGAVPYPANIGPNFPVPGVCTQYPKNVILTLSSSQIPWWPFNN